MGYDMYVKDPPPSPDEADEEAIARWNDDNYFRLNIWGMSEMRRLMTDALDWEMKPPEWPDTRFLEGTEEEQDERAKALLAPVRAITSPTGNVPLFKFSSNDGWLITPNECRRIADVLTNELKHWNMLGSNQSWKDVVKDFINFNTYAAAHGGYEIF
jgi:hypothetical protein